MMCSGCGYLGFTRISKHTGHRLCDDCLSEEEDILGPFSEDEDEIMFIGEKTQLEFFRHSDVILNHPIPFDRFIEILKISNSIKVIK